MKVSVRAKSLQLARLLSNCNRDETALSGTFTEGHDVGSHRNGLWQGMRD